MKETERALVNAIVRAMTDVTCHPKLRESERLKKITGMQADAERDASESALRDAQEKRTRKRERQTGLALEEETEPSPFTNVSDEERRDLLEFFDLSDDNPDPDINNHTQVTKVLLDDAAETLMSKKWWPESRGPVRRVLINGQAKEQPMVRAPSRIEQLWQSMLIYQEQSAWTNCQKAAKLAGSLLLLDWERSGRYSRVMEKSAAEAWSCPELFFGGLYVRELRRMIGIRLKPLFEKQRALVYAAIEYAKEARNHVLYWGTGKGSTGYEGAEPNDEEAKATEIRANDLVMQFFPWAEPDSLGKNNTICRYEDFQKDIALFAEVYDAFWRERRVDHNDEGRLCRVPDSECTWDRVTSQMCPCKSRGEIKDKVMEARELDALLRKNETAGTAPSRRTGGNNNDQRLATPVHGAVCSNQHESVSAGETEPTSTHKRSQTPTATTRAGPSKGGSLNPARPTRTTRASAAASRADNTACATRSIRAASLPLPRQTRADHTVELDNDARAKEPKKRKSPPGAGVSKKQKPPLKRSKPQTVRRITRGSLRSSNTDEMGSSNEDMGATADDENYETESDCTNREPATTCENNATDKIDRDDIRTFQIEVVPEVQPNDARALSVVFPTRGERFENLKRYSSLPILINLEAPNGKVDCVATGPKRVSGTVYSTGQVTTAPHLVHPLRDTKAIQGAAAATGSMSINLDGKTSNLNSDFTFLVPGTALYNEHKIADALKGVTRPVFSAIYQGLSKYGLDAPMTEQKANEHVGASRKAFNFGVGYSGHGWEAGILAPNGEFAEPAKMNLTNVKKYFPDEGRCLGVLFEAMGKVQEAIVKALGHSDIERTNTERNSKYAGEVGRCLHKPGCEAGECLFISIECAKSKIMGKVIERLSKYVKKKVDAQRVHLHVDPQNPDPSSPYSRVVFATWTLYFVSEGEDCAMQFTAILCNRSSICNRDANNQGVQRMRKYYLRGVARFEREHGDVHYEQDGLGLFSRTTPLIVSYLDQEPRVTDKKRLGTWVGHKQVDGEEGQYELIRAKRGNWYLTTVGDQQLRRNPKAKGTSDVAAITATSPASPILHGCMHTIRANMNKMAPHCAVRHAAKLVATKFELSQQHVWNLFFCQTQHYICSAIFIAKCLSLTTQWQELWAPPRKFGLDWLKACKGDGFDGLLASLFMNMTPVEDTNSVSGLLKRVPGASLVKGTNYTPEFCAQQIELLRQFGDDLENSKDSRSTVDILDKARNDTRGTLAKVVNVGKFVAPQIHTGLFLWGLADIPCWRASECPIMDEGKDHFSQEGAGDADQVEKLLRSALKVKSIEAAHRGMLIIAHEFGTCVIKIENGGCEGVRVTVVQDILLEGMDSFDLRPTEESRPYRPSYELWYKPYGEEGRWVAVKRSELAALLRVAYK